MKDLMQANELTVGWLKWAWYAEAYNASAILNFLRLNLITYFIYSFINNSFITQLKVHKCEVLLT